MIRFCWQLLICSILLSMGVSVVISCTKQAEKTTVDNAALAIEYGISLALCRTVSVTYEAYEACARQADIKYGRKAGYQ